MYQKSILRSLVMDGGIELNQPAQLRDLLAEQAEISTSLATIGTVGGGASMFLGLLMSAVHPGALIALVSGAVAVYLGFTSKSTTAEEKEFRLLGKHGRIVNLLGQYVGAGNATPDEVLSAYESLVGCYLMAHDAIVYQGQSFPAAEIINQLPQMVQQQRSEVQLLPPLSLPPATAKKSVFGPSRLAEYKLLADLPDLSFEPIAALDSIPPKIEPPPISDPWEIPAIPPPIANPSPNYRLIDLLLDNPLLTRIIVAGQRTGKTYSAAIASWSVARQHNIRAYYLNLYDHGQGNAELFDHCDRVVCGNLIKLGEVQREALLTDALQLIQRFVADSDAVLIIDEWMSFGAKRPGKKEADKAPWEITLDYIWARLFEQLSHFNSVGIASGKAIWAIAPYFQAGALRDEAKPIKNSEAIVLSIAPNQTVEWINPLSGNVAKIGYNSKIAEDVAVNWSCKIPEPSPAQSLEWQATGVNRIYWHGGKWRPIGDMPAKPTIQKRYAAA